MLRIRQHSEENVDQLQANLEVCHRLHSEVNPTWTQLLSQREALRLENTQLRAECDQKQKLSELGQHTTVVIQELCSILDEVHLQISLDHPESATLMESVKAIREPLQNLQYLSKSINAQSEWTKLSTVVREVLAGFAVRLQRQGVRVFVDSPDACQVFLDENLFRIALRNLIANALDSMPDRGELHITIFSDQGVVEIEVADSGDELDLRDINNLSEKLSGLRTRVVQQIVAAHQGRMLMTNCHEGGAACTLRFPQPQPQALRRAA